MHIIHGILRGLIPRSAAKRNTNISRSLSLKLKRNEVPPVEWRETAFPARCYYRVGGFHEQMEFL